MLISAVLIPLVMLAAVLAPSWYEEWKTYSEATRLPVSPPTWSARARLSSTIARSLGAWATSAHGRLAPGAGHRAVAWVFRLRRVTCRRRPR